MSILFVVAYRDKQCTNVAALNNAGNICACVDNSKRADIYFKTRAKYKHCMVETLLTTLSRFVFFSLNIIKNKFNNKQIVELSGQFVETN